MHGPIGDSCLMAFFDCPRGHRVAPETRVFSNTGLTLPVLLPLEIERLKNPRSPPGNVPRDRTGLSAEALKLLVVSNSWRRTYLLLPHDQRDRGNLSCQGQAGHRGLPPLGEQSFIEIVHWSAAVLALMAAPLKYLEGVVVVLI